MSVGILSWNQSNLSLSQSRRGLDPGHRKLIKIQRVELHFQLECRKLQETVASTLTMIRSQISYKIIIVLKPSES